MLQFKSVTVKTPVWICDRCGLVMAQDAKDTEWEERFIISFRAGYASIFGDGNFVEGDFCQTCIKSLLGQWLRLTEDNPFDHKYQPISVPHHIYQDYQFDPAIQIPSRVVSLAQLSKNLDEANQMRTTLAAQLSVAESQVDTIALKYLLHATETFAKSAS